MLFLKHSWRSESHFHTSFLFINCRTIKKKKPKGVCPSLKTLKWSSHYLSACHSCTQVKDSGKNKTFYKFVMPSVLLLQISQSCNMLQAESIFNNSHLLVHILGYIRGHAAHLALIINLIMLSKYQLSRIFTEDKISPVTLSSQTAQKLNNQRTLQALP